MTLAGTTDLPPLPAPVNLPKLTVDVEKCVREIGKIFPHSCIHWI